MEEICKKCFKTMKDSNMCSDLVVEFFNQSSDYDSFEKMGFYFLKAYVENDIDGVIKALSGYDMKELLEIVEAKTSKGTPHDK